MRLQLPDPGNGPHAAPLRTAFEALRRAFMGTVTTGEAVPLVLLQAPDGGTWRVTVSNAGALQVVRVG